MKVQIVTPYRVSHLQRYGVTVRGNVTSVYPPLDSRAMTQAVNFRPFTPKAHFCARSSVCGICSVTQTSAQTSGALAELRKANISFVMSVRLSVHVEQLGSHCADFHEV
jgi:hypothetical protein